MTGFYSTTSPASLTGRIRFFGCLKHCSPKTAVDDGSESLSPPLPVQVKKDPASAGVRAPWRQAPQFHVACFGEKLGRPFRPPRASGPVPPEEPAPTATSAVVQTASRIRVSPRAGDMPTSGPSQ